MSEYFVSAMHIKDTLFPKVLKVNLFMSPLFHYDIISNNSGLPGAGFHLHQSTKALIIKVATFKI